MLVSAIWAQAKNRVIGKDGGIPWYLPADFKYFKKVTLGHHVIMGRKTYESIGKPLPKRTNIVVTRDPFYVVSNCIIAHSVDEALDIAQTNGEEEAFIIGGSEIYKLAMPYLDRIYLTEVELDPDGDTLAPDLVDKEWKVVSKIENTPDGKNEHPYNFLVLQRKV